MCTYITKNLRNFLCTLYSSTVLAFGMAMTPVLRVGPTAARTGVQVSERDPRRWQWTLSELYTAI